MIMKKKILLLILILGIIFPLQKSFAHCDTKNGPVIIAAKEALKISNVNLILIWVQKKDESIIKEAFQKTVDLRKISPAVQLAVDKYFFETLVRIHRAGEGVPYTGIKDSTEVEAPISASEEALEKKSIADVMKLLNDAINKGLNEKFQETISKKDYAVKNVDEGREYVESYIALIHYVEAIYNTAAHTKEGHHEHEMVDKVENGNIPSKSPLNQNSTTTNYLTNILIIGGTILIIIVQIILSHKK